MEDKESTLVNGSGNSHITSEKTSGRTSLLDSGEDFEVLEDVDDEVHDDLPPLEDAGGGKKQSSPSETPKAQPDPSPPQEEWLDVLGTQSY